VTLKDWMRAEGRNIAWLAEKMRVSKGTISRWRTGDHKPRGPAAAYLEEITGGAVPASQWETDNA
jgi:DNA-binding transcriptional regulator YiaG